MRYLMLAAMAALCACANTPEGGQNPPNDGGACTGSDCPSCDDDGDCQNGRCVDGTCVLDPPECLHDNWCPDGQRCVDGTCTTPPDGGTCTGTCPECGGDEDCPTDQHCDDGACVPDDPPPVCDGDEDCPDGQVCDGGTCVCDGDDDDGSDGACRPGKILICHYPPGHPNPPHQKCVGESSQTAHLAHGDTLGACP